MAHEVFSTTPSPFLPATTYTPNIIYGRPLSTAIVSFSSKKSLVARTRMETARLSLK